MTLVFHKGEAHVAHREWHSFLRLILKTYDTVSPLSRLLPVGVDKQGLDFSACQAFFSPCLSWSFERPLSLPPRITEHKDTQSCRVIQFVLSSLPHRLFA